MTHYRETQYGFEYGAAEVIRACEHKGHVLFQLKTPRQIMNIRVTPTGLIRIQDHVKNESEPQYSGSSS